jgi:hypothetical protein
VHSELFMSIRTQYQRVGGVERSIMAVIRAWGQAHFDIDWSPGSQAPFEWLGNAAGAAVADYVAALERRDGPVTTRRRLMEGPAHALIFPNLFLGETNIAIVEPVSVGECVHWHTPMFLRGVPQFNGFLRLRLLFLLPAARGKLPHEVERDDAEENQDIDQLDRKALHGYGLRGAEGSSPLAMAPRISVSACTFFIL